MKSLRVTSTALLLFLGTTAVLASSSGPQPEKILELNQYPGDMKLVVGGDYLYLLSTRMLTRIPKNGGEVEWLTELGRGIAGQLQYVDDTVYWTELGRFRNPCGSIRKLESGKAVTLQPKLRSPQSLVVDGKMLYWLDWKDGKIRRWPGSGIPDRIADAGNGLSYLGLNTTRLVADREHLYYSSVPKNPLPEPREDIYRLKKSGGKPMLLAERQRAPIVLAQDKTHVYWISESIPGEAGYIRRVPKTGGPVEDVTTAGSAYQLLVDGSFLYWMESTFDAGYTIKRVPGSGGPGEVLYHGKRQAYRMTMDSGHIYWIELGHLKGECRKVYPGCGQNPMPPETVCNYPEGHILRLPKKP
jgi:hypothetical protein